LIVSVEFVKLDNVLLDRRRQLSYQGRSIVDAIAVWITVLSLGFAVKAASREQTARMQRKQNWSSAGKGFI
jgi:hypothetical protein